MTCISAFGVCDINSAIGFGVVMFGTCGILYLLKLKQEGWLSWRKTKVTEGSS